MFLKLRLVLSLSFQYVLYRHAYLLRGTPEVSRALFIWDNISGSIIIFLDSSVLPTSTLKSLQLYPWATQFSFWSISSFLQVVEIQFTGTLLIVLTFYSSFHGFMEQIKDCVLRIVWYVAFGHLFIGKMVIEATQRDFL